MRYEARDGTTVEIPANPSNLTIYQACRKANLLRNRTHSALDYSYDEQEITIHNAETGAEILALTLTTVGV